MNKYYLIGLGLVTIIAAYFIFGNKNPEYIKPFSGENIIVFGDSLAAGQGSTTGNDIASLLAEKTRLPVINAGVSGDTTNSALPRLESDVLAKNPRVVIILLGGNDFFQKIPNDKVISNLTTMIDRILQTGSGVILINENKIFGSRPLFEQLAKEKNIPYMEHILGGIIDDKSLMSDTIHPNNAGYEIMAEKIKVVLTDYLAH
jgi:acyl-CoA thioesterase-1